MAENTGGGEAAAAAAAAAAATAPVTRTSSNVSFSLQRKRSQAERIDEILQTAYKRADAIAAAAASGAGTGTASPRSPRAPSSPVLLGRQHSSAALPIPEDSSADEMTGIMSRASEHNYHSLHFTTNGPPRSRKSTIRSRRSRPPSVQSDAVQQPAREDDMDYRSQGQDQQRETPSWWKTQLARFQSVELENKGSVARDHLAIERTFLAWLRTSLAFASIGIAVTQLFRLNTSLIEDGKGGSDTQTLRQMGKPLGATFLAISILILFLGYKRYFMSQEWVMKGKFPASRGTVMIVAFVAFAIMVASLVVVIAIQPSAREL